MAHLVALHDAGKAYQSFAVDYLERRQRNEPDEFEETMREVALALNETWPEDTRYYTPNWKEVAEILEAKELPLPE